MIPRNVNCIAIDQVIDRRRFDMIITTVHDDIVAHTAVHRTVAGRSIGGARFVRQGTLSELGHLSSAMTEKCEHADLEVGGQKTIVICPSGLPSRAVRARILADHVAYAVEHHPGAIFGPDIACSEDIMDSVAATPGLWPHVTGLSAASGGLAIDENGYTAMGIDEAAGCFVGQRENVSVAIQGFGAVGAHTARLLDRRGLRVVAVSNKDVTIQSIDSSSIDVPKLFAAWRRGRDAEVKRVAAKLDGVRVTEDPSALFGVRCDVFIPAARTTVLASAVEMAQARRECPEAEDIDDYLDRSGVEAIIEAANHPLSDGARRVASSRGVQVYRDTLVNCGGLIACYAELNNRAAEDSRSLASLAVITQVRIRSVVLRNLRRSQPPRCGTLAGC